MTGPGRPGTDARRLAAAGLGLDHGGVRLVRVPVAWPALGAALAGRLSRSLGVPVVHIGSTTVAGMWAKPVIDLAVGAADDDAHPGLWDRLQRLGWVYRGDAGPDDGGHVFVLESRPARRVAHVHVVRHRGPAWCRYLGLVEVLAASPGAREGYGAAKRAAAARSRDHREYTRAKTATVVALLGGRPGEGSPRRVRVVRDEAHGAAPPRGRGEPAPRAGSWDGDPGRQGNGGVKSHRLMAHPAAPTTRTPPTTTIRTVWPARPSSPPDSGASTVRLSASERMNASSER